MVAMTALYVAAEFAAVSVRRSRIRQMAEDGNATAQRLLPILEDASALDRYIAACQVGITLGSLILGAYGQIAFGPGLAGLLQERAGLDPRRRVVGSRGGDPAGAHGGHDGRGRTRAQVARTRVPDADRALHVLADALVAVAARPFIWFLNGSGTLVLRLLGSAHGAHRHVHSPEEIELLDRREPRRWPARTRRTAAPAAGAAFQPPDRARS